MNWTYNAAEYDPNKAPGNYELIPVGDHRARIKSVSEGLTKKPPTRDMITIEMEISGYETTLKHYIVLDPSNSARTNQALGYLFTGFGVQPGNLNTMSWVGHTGGVRVKHEPYVGTDGKEHDGARIAYLLSPDKTATLPPWKGPAAASAPAAQASAPGLPPEVDLSDMLPY